MGKSKQLYPSDTMIDTQFLLYTPHPLQKKNDSEDMVLELLHQTTCLKTNPN